MISFDDLVNSGGDTEQLENEMREIRLNTQINKFSIIDCTNSIESLSSNTLALYNSLTTITGGGGGGFGYLEPYSAHSSESFIYNCNDTLESISFNDTFKEVGPNINFDNVSFTNKQKVSLKGLNCDSCLITSISNVILDYETFHHNSCNSMKLLNVSGTDIKSNLFNYNSNLKINGYSVLNNTINTNSILSLNGFSVNNNSLISNSIMNLTGQSMSFNSLNHTVAYVNGIQIDQNSITGKYLSMFCNNAFKNTCQPAMLDYAACTANAESLKCQSIGHVKIINAAGGSIGASANGALLSVEVFQANTNKFNSVNGYYDLKAASLNVCTVEYNSSCNISAKNITGCSFDHNTFCNINIHSNYGHNSFISAVSLKLNALSATFGYNTFTRLSTFKLNIYTDAADSFNSITELHLRDANIFHSSRSNTFYNISKYIFKYTDGLYSGTDIISDLTSISNKAFIKYVPCSWLNQTFTSSGGSGGFDYWEGYVSHRQNGYNVSGTVKSALIVDNIYSLSPYANFSYCTFQSLYEVHSLNCEYFHTNSFFHNLTEVNIKASEFIENTFQLCKMVNVSACTFTGNYYVNNTLINVSAHNMKSINTFSYNDIVNITCYNTDEYNVNKPIFTGNSYVNIMADNLYSGIIADNSFVNINCKTLKSFNLSNTFNNITAYYIGNNTIAYHNTNINCLFNFSCSNFNDNSVQVRTNSFNLSALYMADNTFSNCSYLTINAGNISRLQLYSDTQAISTNRVLKLKGNSIDSCNIMDYERVYLDCPIMKNIFLYDCPSIYLTTTYDFLKSFVYTSDYSKFNYSDKFIYNAFCTHFDFNDIDLVLDRFGGYSLTQIDKSKCYINGIPLIKLYPDA